VIQCGYEANAKNLGAARGDAKKDAADNARYLHDYRRESHHDAFQEACSKIELSADCRLSPIQPHAILIRVSPLVSLALVVREPGDLLAKEQIRLHCPSPLAWAPLADAH